MNDVKNKTLCSRLVYFVHGWCKSRGHFVFSIFINISVVNILMPNITELVLNLTRNIAVNWPHYFTIVADRPLIKLARSCIYHLIRFVRSIWSILRRIPNICDESIRNVWLILKGLIGRDVNVQRCYRRLLKAIYWKWIISAASAKATMLYSSQTDTKRTLYSEQIIWVYDVRVYSYKYRPMYVLYINVSTYLILWVWMQVQGCRSKIKRIKTNSENVLIVSFNSLLSVTFIER